MNRLIFYVIAALLALAPLSARADGSDCRGCHGAEELENATPDRPWTVLAQDLDQDICPGRRIGLRETLLFESRLAALGAPRPNTLPETDSVIKKLTDEYLETSLGSPGVRPPDPATLRAWNSALQARVFEPLWQAELKARARQLWTWTALALALLGAGAAFRYFWNRRRTAP